MVTILTIKGLPHSHVYNVNWELFAASLACTPVPCEYTL